MKMAPIGCPKTSVTRYAIIQNSAGLLYEHYKTLRSAHTAVFMCFVWIWEQTAIISLYNINWLVFITETECVYCAVRTGS